MRFQALHPQFRLPTRGSAAAGGYDLYMPEAGRTSWRDAPLVGLGFAAAVPAGHVALLLPRSSAGAKYGLELNNTVGVIDADYRGEWKAAMKTKVLGEFAWAAGERVLQFVLVPVATVTPELVTTLDETARGEGGFGSTGN